MPSVSLTKIEDKSVYEESSETSFDFILGMDPAIQSISKISFGLKKYFLKH